jgi:starvation-inducible DNA-binding protein
LAGCERASTSSRAVLCPNIRVCPDAAVRRAGDRSAAIFSAPGRSDGLVELQSRYENFIGGHWFAPVEGEEGIMATRLNRTFETRIDIPERARDELVELLNARLADSFDLYSQMKQAHWNVKGSGFIQLHLLYDDVAESVLGFVDAIAERATALGGLALGTARMAASASTLDEYPVGAIAGMDTVVAISDRLAAYAALVRAGIDAAADLGDQTTADLFTEVSRAIDKHLWFVEAHLQS